MSAPDPDDALAGRLRAARGRLTVAEHDHVGATRSAVERAAAAGLVEVAVTTVDSPIGPLSLAATGTGLVRVGFPHEADAFTAALAVEVSPRVAELPSRLDAVRRQLDEYFEGRRERFDVPVDWLLTRGFRRRTLQALFDDVGYGRTVSYGELATLLGNPGASRAVGTAMATNPVPIVVPCHRVLRAGGTVGNYGGGPEVKRFLLQHEGALLG